VRGDSVTTVTFAFCGKVSFLPKGSAAIFCLLLHLKTMATSTGVSLKRFFPFLTWLPQVNRQTLRDDLIAGLTGTIISLPQGVAFAIIAGMPPIYGLYSAMVMPIITALFGSSWHMITGPATAISIVVFSAISPHAEPGTQAFVELAFVLTFVVGVIQLVMGAARLGTLVNFVSHTVVIGFTAGAGVLIAAKQLKNVFDLPVPQGASFFGILQQVIGQIGQSNWYAFAIAMITLFSAILLKRFWPKLPHMLLGMIIGSVAAYFIGIESHGIKVVGKMPAHLPPFHMPQLSWSNIQLLAPNAFALALLGLIEAVAIARAIASYSHQRINANQEFIGQGLANTIGSFFSSFAGSGSFTRSGVNFQAGARTPLAAIFAAVFLALTLMFVAPLGDYLPISAMGGIILLVAYNLIDVKHIRTILQASKTETAVLLITALSTIFLNLEFAIYVGIIFSLFFYLMRTSSPHITRLAPDPKDGRRLVNIKRFPQVKECPQVAIVRIDGSLYFGAVERVADYFQELAEEGVRVVLLVAQGINFVDLTGAEWLEREVHKWQQRGGDFLIMGLKQVAQDVLVKGGFRQKIGESRFLATKKEGIAALFERGLIDAGVCKCCTARVFEECADMPAPAATTS